MEWASASKSLVRKTYRLNVVAPPDRVVRALSDDDARALVARVEALQPRLRRDHARVGLDFHAFGAAGQQRNVYQLVSVDELGTEAGFGREVDVANVKVIHTVDLSDQKLVELSRVLNVFIELRKLVASHNLITSVSLSLVNLQVLDLSRNAVRAGGRQ